MKSKAYGFEVVCRESSYTDVDYYPAVVRFPVPGGWLYVVGNRAPVFVPDSRVVIEE